MSSRRTPAYCHLEYRLISTAFEPETRHGLVDVNKREIIVNQSAFAHLATNTICRLYLDGQRRYVGLFSDDRKEERVPIADLNDLFQHSERLRATVAHLEMRISSGVEQAGPETSPEVAEATTV